MQARYVDFRIRPADDHDSVDLGGSDAEGYLGVYGSAFTEGRSTSHLITELETHEVIGVMQAEWEDDDPVAVNERVSRAITDHPDRLVAGIATTDPREPNALEVLKHAHDELGLRGWNFQPGFLKVESTDPSLAPLFEYCQENGHPVTVHSGINFSETGPISLGRPLNLDELACRYPELVLVGSHGGWPWVTEMLAVMWKHPNVYADFGAIAPKHMVGSAGGWEPITHWMNSMVSGQVLLATDWPMIRYERLVEELPLLGLKPESFDKYTRLNAAGLIDRFWGTKLVEQLTADA